MIVRKTLSIRRVAGYVGKQTAVTFAWALGITILDRVGGVHVADLSPLPLTILGASLGIFLAFRTNSAYDRWWEARTAWGGLVNFSRTWARQILTFPDVAQAGNALERFQREMVYLQMAFINAVRCHLRKQEPWEEIQPFLEPDDLNKLREEKNVPLALLHGMAMRLQAAYQHGTFDTLRFLALSDTLTELTNLLGVCERLKNTPLPRQYDVFPRLFVYTFCALLPLALVHDLGYWTPAISTVLGFVFIALDRIGYNIEAPFENGINDTPMTALCRTIEINLRQMIGEKDLPPPVEPIDGFLY